MEKLTNPYNKEYMKMAMLKHEDTFREQVFELHRLYQTQKMLMKSIATSTKIIKSCKSKNVHSIINHLEASNGLDLERPLSEEYNNNGVLEKVDESELELTLGPSSFHRRRKSAHPNSPQQLEFGQSFSSSSTNSSHMKSHCHQQKINKSSRAESNKQNWRGVEMKNGSIKVEENLRLNNNPPCFFQALSLNMT